MYACICHAVSEAEVTAEIADGARSVKAIRSATGAGSSCGSCVKRLSCLLAAAAPVEAPEPVRPQHSRGPVREPVRDEPRWKPQIPRLPQHQPGCPAFAPAMG